MGVHIPARKMKYYSNTERKTHHITFVDNFNKCIIFKNECLRDAKIITKACKRNGRTFDDSKFIEVYLDEAFVFDKQDKWKRINRLQ